MAFKKQTYKQSCIFFFAFLLEFKTRQGAKLYKKLRKHSQNNVKIIKKKLKQKCIEGEQTL